MNLTGSIEKLEDISSPCQARAFFNRLSWAIPDYHFYKMFLNRMNTLRENCSSYQDEALYDDLIEDIEIEREKLEKLQDRKHPILGRPIKHKLKRQFKIVKEKEGKDLTVSIVIENFHDQKNLMKTMEKELFLFTLDAVKANKIHASKILGIADRTIRYKIKQYREEKA